MKLGLRHLSLELGHCVQTGWTAPPPVPVGPLKARPIAFPKLEAAAKAGKGCASRNLRPEGHSGPPWRLVGTAPYRPGDYLPRVHPNVGYNPPSLCTAAGPRGKASS